VIPEAGVLVRKLSQLIPLSLTKRANPRYFIHRHIVDSESTVAG
jgi:hypothetical protein